ncbi:hypothetical protein VPH35_060478 [Triticum aestivum]|uniref:LEAF RUST 10 DISEASE-RESISTANCEUS RECEPTOR-LIKE PROTEIN KINASE-like 2.7 n=1 Tax=Triticum aestivum TaxID=4565 RepID=UPI00162CC030|nr:LEAF RUST 10 DISEASE-RESISTANCE LOCUS RECEPTOR-LIKE PROTEIN KINASE-like 2.7 [Triticum aestivum]
MYHLLLLLLVLLPFATADAHAAAFCSNATCGGQSIAYPFWLANSGPNCGYPGLGVSCNENTPILDVQFHQYRVLRIDYANRAVSLADVDAWNTTCPRLSFSLSVDPRSSLQLTPSNSNLTLLYNCKAGVSRPSAVKLDGCPEQSMAWYVLPDDDGATGDARAYGCEEAVTTPVLMSPRRPANPSLREALSGGFQMRYDDRSERCGACEQSGGRCRYGRIEEHGGTGFACVCDDGANKLRCGDALSLCLKRQKLYKIASTSSVVLILFACLLVYKKYSSALLRSRLPCSFHEPVEVSLSLLTSHTGSDSSRGDAELPRDGGDLLR